MLAAEGGEEHETDLHVTLKQTTLELGHGLEDLGAQRGVGVLLLRTAGRRDALGDARPDGLALGLHGVHHLGDNLHGLGVVHGLRLVGPHGAKRRGEADI